METKNQNKYSLFVKIKLIVVQIILSTSCHGIPNIFKSTRIALKTLWIICSVLSASFCCYLVFRNISKYFSYDVTTKIRIESDTFAEFPAITICNINSYTTLNAAELLIPALNYYFSFDQYSKNYFSLYIRNIIDQDGGFWSQKETFGDAKQKLIKSSVFNHTQVSLDEYKYFFHSEYGNCYTFNSGFNENKTQVPIKTMLRNQRSDGLRLELDLSVHEYLKSYISEYGGIIFIHNRTSSPSSGNRVIVGTGFTTNIALRRSFSRSEPKPYSKCDGTLGRLDSHESHFYKLILAKTGFYTQISCIEHCFQKMLVEACNCTESFLESIFDAKFCDFLNNRCYNETSRTFFTTETIQKKCIPICPLECEKDKFSKTVSVQFRNSTNAMVNIYYESLSYEKIEETPMTSLFDLISSVGGVAGLFLGISFLSMVEIIELLLRLLFVFTDKKNNIFLKLNFLKLNF